ncbi:Synaptotagmin-12 [Trichinella zimbabwensis]|uniref:Synaptotagmin-12 n=1 Tax=Trichinella zimbabwensis TaxID=268475 RepID=A0A0V1HSK2_9BILA|nr:Synaptotagmin-12 [Trichinella zimbabwensis]
MISHFWSIEYYYYINGCGFLFICCCCKLFFYENMTMEVAVTVGCVLFVLLVMLICLGCVARHSINQKCAKRANQRASIVSKAGQLHSTAKDANLTIVSSLCKDSANKTETKDPRQVKTEVTPLLQHQKISAPKAMEKTPSTEPSTSDEAQRQSARQASSTVLSTVRRQSSGLYNNIGNIQPELYLRRGSVLTQISGSDYAVGTIRLKLSYDNNRSDFVVRIIEVSLESSTVTKCRVGACLLNGAAQTAPRFIETAAAKGNFIFEEPLKFPIPIDELMRRKLRLEVFGLEPQKTFIGTVELDLLVNDPSADIEVTAEIERRPDAAVITSAEQGNNGELEVRLKYMSSINRLIVTLLQAKNIICDKDASAAEVWIKVKVWQGDRVFKKKKTAAVRFSNPLVLNQALTFNLCEQSVQSLAVEIVLFHGHQWKMTNNLIGRVLIGENAPNSAAQMHWKSAIFYGNEMTSWHPILNTLPVPERRYSQ